MKPESAGENAPDAGAAGRERRKKKKKPLFSITTSFHEKYRHTGQVLGAGASAKVITCVERDPPQGLLTKREFAVKVIEKKPGSYYRPKVLKEIETLHLCQGHPSILQLIEYFEESCAFYLVFEKMEGGPLFNHIQQRNAFSEQEASHIVRDLASALSFLHSLGIAHRDLKPENVLCVSATSPSLTVKLCDFDLCNERKVCSKLNNNHNSTPKLQTPVGSLEYMAPEVLDTFLASDFDSDDFSYDKKCDLWSLGVLMYILLCGSPPFVGHCGQDCGWDNGEACSGCQELLSYSIKQGQISLTGDPWDDISDQAKDLLSKLLHRNASERIDTKALLRHPWLVQDTSVKPNLLGTPKILSRQSSLQDLSNFAKSAMKLQRNLSSDDLDDSEESFPSVSILDLSQSKSRMLQRRNKLIRREIERQNSEFTSIDEHSVLE